MDKPNELRVGNHVLFDGEIVEMLTVSALRTPERGNMVRIYGSFFKRAPIESLSGIPLTEEILLKCGFKINPISRILKSFSKTVKITMAKSEILSISQNSDKNGYFYLAFRQGDNTENNTMHLNDLVFLRRDLQYLHELQNIYFVLTGEEL